MYNRHRDSYLQFLFYKRQISIGLYPFFSYPRLLSPLRLTKGLQATKLVAI